jgi:hypothetical protein
MTKQKQIIVDNVIVKGYVKHPNGKKTLFFDRKQQCLNSPVKIYQTLILRAKL